MPRQPHQLPTLQQLLAPYRRAEQDRAAISACGRQVSRQLLAAWGPAWAAWSPPTSPAPDDLRARWTWLWAHVELHAPDFVAAAGVPQAAGLAAFESIVQLRLVYPDGTIARAAARILEAGAP